VSNGEIAVAAAVIEKPDGSYLLAQRPPGKVFAGYWEFPGGKVESGEPVTQALARELAEELGIRVSLAYPWITRLHAYPHGVVRLHFHRVVGWSGEPHPHEGQVLAWQQGGAAGLQPMLPANAPVLKALSLPTACGITRAGEIGIAAALDELDTAIAGGLKLVQVREKTLGLRDKVKFAAEVVRRVHAAAGLAVVNDDEQLAREVGADGIHLTSRALMAAERRPDFAWCGASCHNEAELARAAALGVDFALVGPVRATPTHPGSTGLGWGRFASIARDCPLPVFALGGLTYADFHAARMSGAHGLAMIRGAWSANHRSSG
jgi:8-oxo-dGTP diphosphatase